MSYDLTLYVTAFPPPHNSPSRPERYTIPQTKIEIPNGSMSHGNTFQTPHMSFWQHITFFWSMRLFIFAVFKVTPDPVVHCAKLTKAKQQQKYVPLETRLRKRSFKWEGHLICNLFLQVTTPAMWIMGAAVPSASPSPGAECVPALTTSFCRRTMSPVQVGWQNESWISIL